MGVTRSSSSLPLARVLCALVLMILFFFTSVEPLDVKEVLEKHRRNFLYVDDTNTLRITVRRSSIWDDALRAVKRTFDEKKHIRITFIGESAVDGGGLRREFFMLLMNAIRENNSG